MTAIEWLFYYDQIARQIVKIKSTIEPPVGYIAITEAHANALAEGERQGGVVYINTAGVPAIFNTPPKPTLKWDETASLTPVAVDNGAAFQIWQINKMSIPEKLEVVKNIRNMRIFSIPFQMAIAERDAEGNKVYKGCTTDPGTTNMMTLSCITATRRPDVIFQDWKFDDGSWAAVRGADLLEAWDYASDQIERHFTIDAIYTQYINAGIEVDVTKWEVLPRLPK